MPWPPPPPRRDARPQARAVSDGTKKKIPRDSRAAERSAARRAKARLAQKSVQRAPPRSYLLEEEVLRRQRAGRQGYARLCAHVFARVFGYC
jgi:hypothetical protein